MKKSGLLLIVLIFVVFLVAGCSPNKDVHHQKVHTVTKAKNPHHFFKKANLMGFGVYYYPEQWPEKQWERDLNNIKKLGFEFTHYGEFAWTFLEPSEGKYDFKWLDKALALAQKANLKVVLCTPTPCPPAWMAEKYPKFIL